MSIKTKRLKHRQKNRARAHLDIRKKRIGVTEKILILVYLAGAVFYSGLGTAAKIPFLTTFEILVGALVWCCVAMGFLFWYEQLVDGNRIFYSRNSWFRRFLDFFETYDDQTEKWDEEETARHEILFKAPLLCLWLPASVLVLAIICSILIIVLVLDWTRLLISVFAKIPARLGCCRR